MAIYGRFGGEHEIVRPAVLEDVQKLDHRKPDKEDRENLKNNCYVVVRDKESGKERLYAKAFLRADGGWPEIAGELEKVGAL